ncbi:hypothetical protein A2331_02305 [Candidatus Falkowbacteria bacterium RIFOXYB2_FULL_34_18]|uniref:Uncharacterized protein n=1 Tax=Candidatus Falkowbacteria bacterium RIFOXYD2_FULL_34_120 TaxID=1798007 RepID=A0A1F5TRZ3_9BACT|nr:MAG: hypothetical protein A2331_02305 [Candidatus Falkowbacteria bacterium RIFOXYB2_FULL_34_18]OGF29704.1 MAG: hypothetical protein A2500_00320 [Candidatus Falkowbacteria bacterium RIFOXYC12_FULL_34_55]OGF37431.1 MAG: hypothetical protein A2466_00400 [Candidatus Falkowbacteria bacterium RIFOXYC2_FULL_34_220]OGF39156.1 MAG: hypothetical protein A2515_00355 [Candidatus Falkowbacteria bacterium RIFOXYD12_FULL_34_57]OGF41705.1 MAG: hypothetical protein A2531_06075 [Candidatus Falkowbacteria bact
MNKHKGLRGLLGEGAYNAAKEQTAKKLTNLKEVLFEAEEEKSIVPWNADQDFFHNDVVWFMRLDNRFMVEVRLLNDQLIPLSTKIYIFDHNNNDELIHSVPVGFMLLSHNKPTIDDIKFWQDQAANYIDRNILKRFDTY